MKAWRVRGFVIGTFKIEQKMCSNASWLMVSESPPSHTSAAPQGASFWTNEMTMMIMTVPLLMIMQGWSLTAMRVHTREIATAFHKTFPVWRPASAVWDMKTTNRSVRLRRPSEETAVASAVAAGSAWGSLLRNGKWVQKPSW